MAEYPVHVGRTNTGAQCCHGIAHTKLGEGNHVHIAFNNNQFIRTLALLQGFVKAVKLAALVKNRCFR